MRFRPFRLLPPIALVLSCTIAPAHAQGSCAQHLLASGYFSNSVLIFDACTGEYLRQLDDSGRIRGPQAVRLDPAGQLLYVVSEGNDQVLRYRLSDYAFVDVFAQFAASFDPTGLDFGAGDDVYVASYGTQQVVRLDTQSGAVTGTVLTASSGLRGPDNGLGVGPDGALYVPGYDSDSVARVQLGSGQVNANYVASGSFGLDQARGILFEPGGQTLLLSAEGSASIYRLRLADGALLQTLATNLPRPTGMAIGSDGSLLVLTGTSRVLRFDRDSGAPLGTFINANAAGLSGGTFLAMVPNPQQAQLDLSQVGTQYWVFGSGPAQSRSVVAELVSATGSVFGANFDPAQVVRKRWGSVLIHFSDCDRAQFSLDSTGADSAGFGRVAYPLVRLVDSEATLKCRAEGFEQASGLGWMSGAWYGVDRSGEGLVLDVSADGIAVVSFYTHRPAMP